jgi:hypothetical protein
MVQVFVCTGRDNFSIFHGQRHVTPKMGLTWISILHCALDSLQLATFACVLASWLKTFPLDPQHDEQHINGE